MDRAKQMLSMPQPEIVQMDRPVQQFNRRLSALRTERAPFITEWTEIMDYIQPRRGRFFVTDRNKPRKSDKVINGTARDALRTLGAGMQSGASSPSRPWFRLTTPDPGLAEFGGVKTWLTSVARRMNIVMSKSNLYNTLQTGYEDIGLVGNAPLIVDEDYDDVFRCTLFTPGEYFLATNGRGTVNTVYREFSKTVIQLIEEFGQNCSDTVKNMYDQGNYDAWVPIVHVIEPNLNQVKGELGPRGMPYICAYYEMHSKQDKLLSIRGYNEWPGGVPRWAVMSGDVYGNGPGLDALGDVKAMQVLERFKAQGIQQMLRPSLQAPSSLQNRQVANIPGGITYTDVMANHKQVVPLYEVNPSGVSATAEEIREHERRINRAFYADLFLMMAQSDRREITAREVAERHEEKLIALGPVLERLHDELFNPIITRIFNIMWRAQLLPPPPKELEGMELRVDYVSMLAQAQRLVSVGAIERLAGFVGNLAGAKPEVLDKVDFDQTVDEYAESLGVPPGIVVSDDDVKKVREDRNKQIQQMQQMAAADTMVKGAKVLSETDMTADSALTRMLGTGAVGP